MDLLLSMSIFTSAAGITSEKAKAQEWMKSWVDSHDGCRAQGGAAGPAAEQGKTQQQQRQEAPRTQLQQRRQVQGRPWLAPEFDGLNCFETLVCH